MIPQNAESTAIDITGAAEYPTNTYFLDMERERIKGFADGRTAMKQAIYKILMTERYKWVIYSWNYGVELRELFGKPIPYCVSEIKRRVTEALTWDTRITAIDGWQFEYPARGTIKTTFNAHTIYGEVAVETEVLV